MTKQKKTPVQMVEAICKLDLDPIKLKLMDKNEGHGWTRSEADRYELEYKRFLALLAKFPDEVIAPNTNVDKFWHGHILDTMKYAEDCQHVFGYFLHHFPYFGMRDEEDAANLASAAVNMQRLYQQEFCEPCAQERSYCGAAVQAKQEQSAYCGAAGKERQQAASTAYCGAAKPSYWGAAIEKVEAKQEQAAYCGIANVSYCGVVAGKGRPKLDAAIESCTA